MATYKTDENGRPGHIRFGDAIIEYMDLTLTTALQNTWQRLMPSGNAATKVNSRQLNLGALRSSLVPQKFNGWIIKILNAGYVQSFLVASCSASGECHLQDPIRLEGTPDSGIQWVMFPDMLDDCAILLRQGSTITPVDIGVTPEDEYAPTNAEIRQIFDLRGEVKDDVFYYKGSALDRLFYRFDSDIGSPTLIWGEFDIDGAA